MAITILMYAPKRLLFNIALICCHMTQRVEIGARKLKQNHVRLLMMTGTVISHEYSAFNIVTVLFHSLFLYSSINTRIRQVLSLESSLTIV